MRRDDDDIIIVRSSDGQMETDAEPSPPIPEVSREEYVVFDGDEPAYAPAGSRGNAAAPDGEKKAYGIRGGASAITPEFDPTAIPADIKRARKTTAGKKKRVKLFGGDKVLWVVIVTLLIFSMLLTFSATVYKAGGTPGDKLVSQSVFIVFGIGMLLLVHFIRYQFYGKLASAIFLLGFALTLLAYLTGPESAEARRDLDIPLVGIRFQPFEILKIGIVMLLAKQLARRQKSMNDTPVMPSFKPSAWKEDAQKQTDIIRTQTIPLLLPILMTCVVTYLSVGNSTTLIIAAACMVMLYIGRVRMADLGKIVGLAAVAAAILFFSGLGRGDTGVSRMAGLKADMLEKHVRINSEGVEFYDYPATVTPSGEVIPAEPKQSIDAKMSIASGKIFGKGPGMSTHRSNLAEAERDFAYAFIIEEYGALGGLLILLLFLWLFFRTIEIFRNVAKERGAAFPSLLVLGLGLTIILQAMMHMLVSVSLFPITGQQLPLISRGGTSLVFTLMAFGMILGISRQTDNRTLEAAKGETLFGGNVK